MKYLLSLLLMFVLLVSCAQSKTKPITEFSQNDIKNVMLVDVRTPEEYSAAHIDNALNINWYDKNFAKQFELINKNKTIYVYCKKGGRSLKAQEKLISLGFVKVINLEGGYDAWKTEDKR